MSATNYPSIQYPWLFSNMEISYPFMPQVYPKYIASIFVDAYIVDGTNLRVDMEPINEQLRLVQFELTDENTAGLMQLQYVSDGSLFFFDNTSPTTEYRVWDFGDWKIVAADNQEERKYVRLTLYTPNIPSYPFELSVYIDGLEATFVARVHEQNLPKVYSIQVTDAETGETHVLDDSVEFRPGYNMTFDVSSTEITSASFDDSEQRLLTQVTFTADPGSGEGRVPADCEEAAEGLKQINFVSPDDDGNLLISADGTMRCGFSYSGTGDVISREDGVLIIDNDGAACCTCEDYGDAYNSIKDLQAAAQEVAESAAAVLAAHCDIVSTMEEEAECREQLDISLVLTAKSAWLVNVMIIFKNNPKCDINAPAIMLTYGSLACGDDVNCNPNQDYRLVEGTAFIYNQGTDDTWRIADSVTNAQSPGVTSEVIPGGSYMALTFDILFTDEDHREAGQEVTGYVAAPDPWPNVSATTNLVGPVKDDEDTEECDNVTAYPPEDEEEEE